MPVVAVVNRKGGSGKSTLATHLAVHCAKSGFPVMLGDTDRNQSTQVWLRLRASRKLPPSAPIVGRVVDPRNVLRTPPGTEHVVLDTPGGLHGFELGRVVCHADAIIIPVCSSVFDRDSAAECWAELRNLPRVASGRCKVAVVGMRLDARTKADAVIEAWAEALGLPFIGVLRETQAYVRSIEHGLTVLDLPPSKVAADLEQWAPIIEWLRPVLHQKPVVDEGMRPSYKPNAPPHERTQGITIPGELTTDLAIPVAATSQHRPGPVLPPHPPSSWSDRLGKVLALPLRRFLVPRD
jgi:chromosome partitioning protein